MLSTVDLLVLVGHPLTVVGIGLWLGRYGRSPDEYMAVNRSLPGWAAGLSMFGSYVSSIPFLALYRAAFFWGVASVGIALATIRVTTVFDAWWNLAGIFSGGVLGLFLLGLISKRADNVAGAIGAVVGVLVILWMTLPTLWDVPPSLRNPLNANLTIVAGTLTIFLVGLAASQIRAPARAKIVE